MISSTIGLGLGAYALGAGAIASATLITRGTVRAIIRARHGELDCAARELLGGLAWPAAFAAACGLGPGDIAAAMALSSGSLILGDPRALAVTLGDSNPREARSRFKRRMACAEAAAP
jgi:hypothetical protein